MNTPHSWTGFYQELADKLLAYRNDRQTLISMLSDVYTRIGMRLPKLEADELNDIDPFTVFGLFNKGITDANRQKIIAGIAEVFSVGADRPTDFEGIPVLNNLNATFYAFTNDERRDEHDIDNLWRVFEAELALAADDSEENHKAFVEAFDATVTQFTLGWKLTMGSFLGKALQLHQPRLAQPLALGRRRKGWRYHRWHRPKGKGLADSRWRTLPRHM